MVMNASVELRSDILEVAYSLQNMTDRRIYAITEPAPEWDDGIRVVQIDFHHGGLMLSRLLLPEPATMKDCFGYHTPESSSVEPGGTLSDRFQVALPARVNISMTEGWLSRRVPVTPMRSRWTDRVTFTLGILVERGQHTEEVTLAKTLLLPKPIEVLDDDEEPDP
jgi:hypothetical protein